MSGYKTTQDVYRTNFGGINAFATVLRVGQNEAVSISNWDISNKGSIKKRGGIVSSSTNPGAASRSILALGRILDEDYAETYVAVANSDATSGYTLWQASSPTGTWTERYGSYKLASAGTPIITGWVGKAYVANGTDQPLILEPGSNAETMEYASLVEPPSTCTVTSSTNIGATSYYGVTSVTPRGESKMSGVGFNNAGGVNKTSITTSDYNTVSWTPIDGCSSQRVYCATINTSAFRLVAEVSPSANSFRDDTTGFLDLITGVNQYAPQATTAYNTPNDWNTVGPPKGFAIVAAGTDERLFAWRGNTVWASSLRDGLDWFSQNDAFAFLVTGGEDNNVTGVASLSDFILVFSRTNTFVYTGASASTISLQKILKIGCVVHTSIAYVRGDIFFWSEYGPTSFRRIDSGADIEPSLNFNRRIQPVIYEDTNVGQWSNITAHADVKNSRIVWSLAGSGSSTHNKAIVYQYDCDGFTSYDSWTVAYAVANSDFSINAVNVSNNKIATLNSTNADDGAAINATYYTGHYDMQSYARKKRVPYVDVIANREDGSYNVSVTWSFDFGYYTSTAIDLTETTTEGNTVETTSSTTTQHRVYLDGHGNTFQLLFSSNNTSGAEILGWRPAAILKGQR